MTRTTDVDESPRPGEAPEALAQRLAHAKAAALSREPAGGIVVAADSVVVLEDEALGKPATPAEAVTMLRRLRGRQHAVVTAVALRDLDRPAWYEGSVRTEVTMRPYDDREIAAYVHSGAPLDKAGAYGIQDVAFNPVARLSGCYLNVVGLPLCEVARGLARLGYCTPGLAALSLQPPCQLCERGAALVGHPSIRDLFSRPAPQ